MSLHPIQRRWQAEDLVRRRRSDEQRRYASPQRAGRIDPNPHQIEAVIFALSRLADGGCILADEVGLGKTIEAGLVIAQLRAEGARRILLITPKSLLGQWRQELYTLFGVETTDAANADRLEDPGVYLIGREAAGGANGQARLRASGRFDLVVIDEAHELFSGLYKRFDSGGFRTDGKAAQSATRVFELIQEMQSPVLLLTATPIQNSLAELWALVRFVDPMGTLLGDLGTFRETFCQEGDRVVAEGQEEQLRRRISVVLRRTLRRQAQEFLNVKFVPRESKLYEYEMSPEEQALYDEVTQYILRPRLAAFRGNQRRLLLIQFQRRMASSTAALASSLEKVALRLEGMRRGDFVAHEELAKEWEDDLDEADAPDLEEEASDNEAEHHLSPDAIAAELQLVQGFAERARQIGQGSKAVAMLKAVRSVRHRGADGDGSGRVVIFTESVVTQEHLRTLLLDSGVARDDEITLFRGQNDGPRAREATQRWWAEVGNTMAPHTHPARDVVVRLALVHEFKTRSKIFISTEAGAKGLNLQFCETVINYDLPWNPQRIEQRIGRCHRYGQTRKVSVINFLAADNETERLIFEILSQKLELFGTVLDASDAILHQVDEPQGELLAGTLGAELEAGMWKVYQAARSAQDIANDVRALRDRIEAQKQRFKEEQARTATLISTYLDEDVRSRFRKRKDELPSALRELDNELGRLVREYLAGEGVPFSEAGNLLTVPAHPNLPAELVEGLRVAIGAADAVESLHLGHPLAVAAVTRARTLELSAPVTVELPQGAPAALIDRRGGAGRLRALLVRHEGLEPVDRLVAVAVFEGELEAIPPEAARALLGYTIRPAEAALEIKVDPAAIEDAVEEAIFLDRGQISAEDAARFDRGLEQIEAFLEDRLFLMRRDRAQLEERRQKARDRRAAAPSNAERERAEAEVVRLAEELSKLEEEIAKLERRDDETYERCKAGLFQRKFARPVVETLFDVGILVE